MAANTNPIFGFIVKTSSADLENADGTAAEALFTAGGANEAGGFINKIAVTSTSSAAETIVLTHTVGGVDNFIGEVDIPAGSGVSTANVNLLDSTRLKNLQNDGSLSMGEGDVLKINAKVAVTSGKVAFVAYGGSY